MEVIGGIAVVFVWCLELELRVHLRELRENHSQLVDFVVAHVLREVVQIEVSADFERDKDVA